MSGHSKWNNIKHKKGKNDAAKAKIFTKIGKEIAIAVKEGGPNPSSNGKLRDLIAKAKENNVPNDNIERSIKKAASADSANYEVIYYEGYGPSGIAVIVEAMTDNRNRTSGDLRHYFDKFGGNMGTTGCVSFLFEDKGVITASKEGIDEDQITDYAIEAGADDVNTEDEECYEITCDPNSVADVRKALEGFGVKVATSDTTKIPSTMVTLDNEDDVIKMNRLLDAFDENDDVTNVWHNWDAPVSDEEE